MIARARTIFYAHDGEPVDALGTPWRLHYWLVALGVTVLCTTPLAISFTPAGEGLAVPAIRGLCVGAMPLIAIVLILARRWRYESRPWFFHAAFTTGTVVLGICALTLGEVIAPMLALILMMPLGAAYMLSPRAATPHIAVNTIAIAAVYLLFPDRDAVVRTVFLAIVAGGGSIMLVAMKRHLASVIALNHSLSEHDPLTGVANLRRFSRMAAAAIARHERGAGSFALVAIDLDDFKQTNDRYSHSVGDDVLVKSTAAIKRLLTDADLLVRRGGDEFLILAEVIPGRDLGLTLSAIRGAVAAVRLYLTPDIVPSVSIAYVHHVAGETAEELLGRVDNALHGVKIYAPSTRRGTSTLDRAIESFDATEVAAAVTRHHGGHDQLRTSEKPPAPAISHPLRGSFSIAWKTAAFAALAFSMASVAIASTGTTSVEPTPGVLVPAILGALVLAPACLWFARPSLQTAPAQVLLGLTVLAVITAECLSVGDAAPSMAEMYLMPILLISALLSPRIAIPITIVIWSIYAAFLFGYGGQFVEMRFANTVVNLTFLSSALAMMRSGTVREARHNAMLASTDALTGLPNLRRLRSRIEDEIRRCSASGRDFGLAMLDLDAFKSVNDRHSHSIGDRTLIAVADALRTTCRQADMPARRGGDEFAVVLISCDQPAAEAAANRIGSAIAEARQAICGEICPTASIAWVFWHPGEGVDDLLGRVDLALHLRKAESHQARELTDASAGSQLIA